MGDQRLDNLLVRIDRLELLATILGVVVVVMALGFLILMIRAVRRRDTREQFVLRDRAGRERISMWTDEKGQTAVSFHDAEGRVRLGLGLFDHGEPGIGFHDR